MLRRESSKVGLNGESIATTGTPTHLPVENLAEALMAEPQATTGTLQAQAESGATWSPVDEVALNISFKSSESVTRPTSKPDHSLPKS